MKLLLWVNDKGPFSIRLGDEPFLIGRDESCDFQIKNDSVSREHVTLELLADELFIKDAESYNGCIVDRKIIDGKTAFYLPADIYLGQDVKLHFEQARPKHLTVDAKQESR